MTYLVTGGAGFIGSHIVESLLKRGHRVRVLDNFSSGKKENLEFLTTLRPSHFTFQLIKGDIREMKTVRRAVKDVDYILHQAALRSVPKSLNDPISYNEVNITGTLNVLLCAKDARVKRVVFASSSSVYGDTDRLPQKESQLPQLISPYASTKLAGEYYCRVFTKSYGLDTVCLRYFNVFGPRQNLENQYAVVIPKFIICILKGQPPPVDGDGRQSRDFTYIDNVIEANLLACRTKGIGGMVFNVACGSAYTVLDVVDRVNKILKKNISPVYVPPRPGDVRHTLADITQAKNILGLKIKVDFEEGLKRTVEWFSNRNPAI